MKFEANYIEYGLQTAFTVIAMSMLLMLDTSEFSSYVFALGIPFLFGYTAYISSEGFNKASLASVIALVYIPISTFIAFVAFVVFVCNNFISLLNSSDSFRAYYSSTAVPLILTGLVLGAGLAGFSYVDPGFESEVEEYAIEFGTEKSIESIEVTGLADDDQEQEMQRFVNQTLDLIEVEVAEKYSDNAENPNNQALQESFDSSKPEVRQQMIYSDEEQREVMEEEIKRMLQNIIGDRIIIIAIPLSIIILYALQPVLGLLTAFYAQTFKVTGRKI